jgi:hypothetical protein
MGQSDRLFISCFGPKIQKNKSSIKLILLFAIFATANNQNMKVILSTFFVLIVSLDSRAQSLHAAFQNFIDAENRKDTAAVRKMLWDSPDMVFAPFGKRDSSDYLGFWGTQNAMSHFNKLYALGIHLQPDYQKERIAFLSKNVAELFIPAKISFPDRAPFSFLVITYWTKIGRDWRLASDIAIPLAN